MDRLSNKLLLNSKDRVLDIGCGWGSLSLHMSNNYKCNVKGISLSEEQIKYCNLQKQKHKDTDLLEYSLKDYRHENVKYTKIVLSLIHI